MLGWVGVGGTKAQLDNGISVFPASLVQTVATVNISQTMPRVRRKRVETEGRVRMSVCVCVRESVCVSVCVLKEFSVTCIARSTRKTESESGNVPGRLRPQKGDIK